MGPEDGTGGGTVRRESATEKVPAHATKLPNSAHRYYRKHKNVQWRIQILTATQFNEARNTL